MSNILVITEVLALFDRLQKVVNSDTLVHQFTSDGAIDPLEEICQQINETNACVVVIGADVQLEWAFSIAAAVEQTTPRPVLLVAEPSIELWTTASRAGIRELIDVQSTDEQIAESLHAALAAAVVRVASPPEVESFRGRVITVAGPKGGSGKTTVATNLAVGLSALHPGKVALIDLDVYFGDADIALGLDPDYSIVDLINTGEVDATALKVYLTTHESGLYLLSAPKSLAQGDQIGHEAAIALIALLRTNFDYVIVDTAPGIDDRALEAIGVSDDVLLLAETDTPSIRSLRKLADALDSVGYTSAKRHLVLNRSNARVGVRQAEVEANMRLPIDVNIPSNRAVPQSMNQGVPVIMSAPKSAPGKAYGDLVRRISDPAFTSHKSGRGER